MTGITSQRPGSKESSSVDDDQPFTFVIGDGQADDEGALADAIEADGRRRQRQGLNVTLKRYLHAVPAMKSRPVVLDAAIDVTLRSLSGGSEITSDAVTTLVAEHPEFSAAIREAAELGRAVCSTQGLQARVESGPRRSLPCEFGPVFGQGERRYQLRKLLGRGAFGHVYLAMDRQLSEAGHTAMVAIKIANAGHLTPWLRQKAVDEAAKVRRVNHPNVVTVHDRNVTDAGEDFMVYEYVEGGDLDALLAERRRIPPHDAVAMMIDIARGVHAAHAAGVIHCDLKPGNIMLTAAGEAKVVDFGIAVQRDQSAESSESGEVGKQAAGPIGNLAFISPEQYRGEDGALSVPSDVYALGGILCFMMTGTLPNGSTLEEIRRTHEAPSKETRIAPPSLRTLASAIDRDLELICRKAIETDPACRHHSAAAFADDLERWRRHEAIAWTRPGVLRVIKLWAIRKPALAVSVGVIALLLMAGSIIGIRLNGVAQDRKLAAAVAEIKLMEREQWQANAAKTATKISNSVRVLGDDYRLKTEAIVKIWIFEYLLGPQVLGMPDQQRSLWMSRVEVLRTLVHEAQRDGRDHEFEPLLLSSLLAFFLVNDGDFEESIPLLDVSLARWSSAFSDDPWLNDLRAIRLGAEVNRLVRFPTHSIAAIEGLNEQLQIAIDGQQASRAGTPIHFLLLKSQAMLHGPSLLNQPEREKHLRQVLADLIDNAPANVPASQPTS